MKLQNKIALTTLLATCALIGTGFAAWTFTNAVQTQSNAEATPQIVCAVELNDDFQLYKADGTLLESIYLICDAPSDLENTLGGHGVYWSSKNDATAYANKIDSVYIQGTLHYNAYDIAALTSVTVTFTKGEGYALENGTYIHFADATIPTVTVTPVVDNAEVKTSNFALPTPSYVGVDSSTFDSVDAVANITDELASTLTIVYQAQITAQTPED